MQAWAIQQFRGCSVHVLAVLGRGARFHYAYTGFVCAPKGESLAYPQLQRFHHTAADFDSADEAISAGMQQGQSIVEQWFASGVDSSRMPA